MSVKREGTIPVVLDGLDFEANAFLGFTNMEFAMTICACGGFYAIALVPISSLLFGSAMYGFIGSIALGVFSGVGAAAKAETLKKGRPSYMLWIDLKRHLQFKGLWGAKFSFGFTSSKRWDVIDAE